MIRFLILALIVCGIPTNAFSAFFCADSDDITITYPALVTQATCVAAGHRWYIQLDTDSDNEIDADLIASEISRDQERTDAIAAHAGDADAHYTHGTAAAEDVGYFEPAAGNPASDGWCFKSTTLGVRSWGECGTGGGGTTDHSALSNLDYASSGHTGFATSAQGSTADTALQPGDVDDTPVDAATTAPVSSNWAYDHENTSTSVHGISDTSTLLDSSTNFGGDVTGTYNALQVGTDTHSHTATTLPTNSQLATGLVSAGASNLNKVWKTDASGNPGWRDDADSGGAPSFDAVTSGTNTNSLVIGTSGSLGYTDTGYIDARRYQGVTTVDATEFGLLNGRDTALIDTTDNIDADQLVDGSTNVVTNWNNAYTHVSADGSSHTFINQDVSTTASPSFVAVTANLTGDVTGNADTATELAVNPDACGTGYTVTDIAADGTLTCTLLDTEKYNPVNYGAYFDGTTHPLDATYFTNNTWLYPQGTWSGGGSYSRHDIVKYGTVVYQASMDGGEAEQPDLDTNFDYWFPIYAEGDEADHIMTQYLLSLYGHVELPAGDLYSDDNRPLILSRPSSIFRGSEGWFRYESQPDDLSNITRILDNDGDGDSIVIIDQASVVENFTIESNTTQTDGFGIVYDNKRYNNETDCDRVTFHSSLDRVNFVELANGVDYQNCFLFMSTDTLSMRDVDGVNMRFRGGAGDVSQYIGDSEFKDIKIVHGPASRAAGDSSSAVGIQIEHAEQLTFKHVKTINIGKPVEFTPDSANSEKVLHAWFFEPSFEQSLGLCFSDAGNGGTVNNVYFIGGKCSNLGFPQSETYAYDTTGIDNVFFSSGFNTIANAKGGYINSDNVSFTGTYFGRNSYQNYNLDGTGKGTYVSDAYDLYLGASASNVQIEGSTFDDYDLTVADPGQNHKGFISINASTGDHIVIGNTFGDLVHASPDSVTDSTSTGHYVANTSVEDDTPDIIRNSVTITDLAGTGSRVVCTDADGVLSDTGCSTAAAATNITDDDTTLAIVDNGVDAGKAVLTVDNTAVTTFDVSTIIVDPPEDNWPLISLTAYKNTGAGEYPIFMGRMASGTKAAPLYPETGDEIFSLVGRGYNENSADFVNGGLINIAAGSTWTATNRETEITIQTIPNGSTSTGIGFRLSGDKTIDLPGYATGGAEEVLCVDSTGNVTQDCSVSATIAPDSVALTTDTTGNYVASATANQGLTMTGTEGGSLGITPCTGNDGYVQKWNDSLSQWACAADDGGTGSGTVSSGTTGQFAYYGSNGTTVSGRTLVAGDIPTLTLDTDTSGVYVESATTGGGLVLTDETGDGDSLGLRKDCTDNYILKWNDGAGTWDCEADLTGTSISADDSSAVIADTGSDASFTVTLDGGTGTEEGVFSIVNDSGSSVMATKQIAPDSDYNSLSLYTYSSGAVWHSNYFQSYRAYGTESSPSAVAAGATLGAFDFFGYTGSGFVRSGNISSISESDEAWSATASTQDATLQLRTTLDGSNRTTVQLPAEGGFQFKTMTKPTCNETLRGTMFYVAGGAGVADTMEACMKNASDTYAWTAIATP